MFQLALKGVRHNVGRYVATLIAIMTGVAFFTATGFLSQRVIDSLEGSVDQQFGAVDVAVVVDDTGEDPGAWPSSSCSPRRTSTTSRPSTGSTR